MSKLVSKKEEILNTWSHGLGAVFALVGSWYLWDKGNGQGPYANLSILMYGTSLFALFTSSTVYHAVASPRLKRRFRILDHISIYMLIAGTYTPVALISLLQGNGITLFFVVWGIAGLGTLFKVFYTGRLEFVSLLLYLIMGWLIVFDFQNLLEVTTGLGIRFLLAGGLFYTVGIVFYAWQRIPYNHFIWHLFVLGGAACHWFFIYLDVV
ncbi:PAQR family membrane homeostasis protein TrhA [Maribacter sp. 2307ULW6-5]|uniref:PAQR family membrane homeostasis protein TrhA n=1 Tax=Maribacter sp. 2307ULW6-5 TaxID=3386275 RepID=UPI0039BCFF87